MARSYWQGAITVGLVNANVKAYNLTVSEAKDGFKSLCPCHSQPIKAPWLCAVDGTTEIPRANAEKGFEPTKGQIVPIPAELLANAAPKSETLVPDYFAPIDSLQLHRAGASYRLLGEKPADVKVLSVLWQTLDALQVAAITEWTPRGAGKDTTVAIHAARDGLTLTSLPCAEENSDAPAFEPMPVADGERQMFEQLVQMVGVKTFDPAAHTRQWRVRNERAKAAAMTGKPIEIVATAAPEPAVPDLMAALQASLAAVKPATAVPEPEKVAA